MPTPLELTLSRHPSSNLPCALREALEHDAERSR
jgi:hypothetical protein